MKRKVLAWLLTLCMVITMIPAFAAAETEAPALPTATVTDIEKDGLTFALKFKADDATEPQQAYYGSWYADYVLTVNKDVTFNADGTADGYLSGQYDTYDPESWMNVPFENVELKAGESIRIMKYASETLNKPDLKITYNDVLEFVKEFNCGVFFTEKYMAANPDLEVTLELRLYNPADENENYVIGETYTFPQKPELPTATVTEVENEDLTFAMNFKADEVTDKQLKYYKDWNTDFVLTVNQEVTFDANGTGDGYLSGSYEAWNNGAWVNVPFDKPVTLKAGESIAIMDYAATALNQSGLKLTYNDVYSFVKDFDCGVFFEKDFLRNLKEDLVVTLELRMTNPADPTESYTIGKPYTFTYGVMPTATISKVENEDLTFAMNFKADEVSDATLETYKDWHTDFVLTTNQDVTFDANGTGDGYLSGSYEAWNNGAWVNVPFDKPVTLKAGESFKIMDYAATALNQPGLKLTYNDVYGFVKDFDCGAFFEKDFLRNLEEDLVVTLELRMYNPEDPDENYKIGETYTFKYGVMPTATVTEIENEDLTFAMNFKADPVSDATLETYKDWNTDFVLTTNKKVTFNADGTADGYLSGSYDAWNNGAWVDVPFDKAVTLEAGESIAIMDYASKTLNQPGLKLTYNDVYTVVKDFDCGVLFDEEFLAKEENQDLLVKLELRMTNPADPTESYVIGDTYYFYLDSAVCMNVETEKVYTDLNKGLLEAEEGQTVVMLKDIDLTNGMVSVPGDITLDLDGYKLTTGYMACFGDIVDNSDDNAGLLKVDANRFMLQNDNAQLPVKNNGGYQFVEIVKFNQAVVNNGIKYGFQPRFEAYGVNALKDRSKADTGVTVNVQVDWVKDNNPRVANFEYSDALVDKYLNSFNAEKNTYSQMMSLTLNNAETISDYTFKAVVKSDTGVVFETAPIK